MSNRARRCSLRKMRLRAIFASGALSPDDFDSMKALNRWQRFAFRAVWREPLRFADNAGPDPGLINIQKRNQPALFNPLRDPVPDRPEHLKEYGNRNDPLFLWGKIEAAISDALQYLEPARQHAGPRFDWSGWAWWRNNPEHPNAPKDKSNNDPAAGWLEYCEDFPAEFHLGFLRLRVGMMAVHQYGDRGRWFRDHGQAARSVLRVDQFKEQITEVQIYALLTLAACWWALDALQELPEEAEQWPGWKLDYIAGLVHDAERWLTEAYRLEQGETQEAKTRKEWEADSHRATSAKGGEKPKGSAGIALLAVALRKERDGASPQKLFDLALARCHEAGEIEAGDFRITANHDCKLVSTGPDGNSDGQPVGFEAWRKNYMGRKR